MADHEPRQTDSYLLTPEYWGGHEPEDTCPAGKRKPRLHSPRQELHILKFVKPLLADFLSASDRKPLRTFGKGEHFLADQFTEGTIVEFALEQLRSGSGNFSMKLPPYSTEQMLGVVYGYEGKRGRETAIMGFEKARIGMNMDMGFPPLYALNGFSYSLLVIIGDVSHEKERGKKNRDYLERITGLTVHKIGKDAPQEAKKGLRLPQGGGSL